jgi:hypothetical protein
MRRGGEGRVERPEELLVDQLAVALLKLRLDELVTRRSPAKNKTREIVVLVRNLAALNFFLESSGRAEGTLLLADGHSLDLVNYVLRTGNSGLGVTGGDSDGFNGFAGGDGDCRPGILG